MLGMKNQPSKGSFEQEWRRWYPHDDDPPELAQWAPEYREFIFEQFMKIHRNSDGREAAETVNAELTKDFGGVLLAAGLALVVVMMAFAFMK